MVNLCVLIFDSSIRELLKHFSFHVFSIFAIFVKLDASKVISTGVLVHSIIVSQFKNEGSVLDFPSDHRFAPIPGVRAIASSLASSSELFMPQYPCAKEGQQLN